MSNKTDKQESKHLVPRLRFKEFRDAGEWEEKELQQTAQIFMGSSPPSSSYNEYKSGLPFMQGNADIEKGFSAPRMFTSQPTKECEAGDILLCVRAPVGEIAKSIHHACIGRGLSAIRSNGSSIQEYLYQWMIYSQSRWKHISQGGTFDAVNSNDVKNFLVAVPQKPEQQKIADCLSSLDALIGAHSDKLDALKAHKKGLLQQLFPQEGKTAPRLRFKEFRDAGEWEEFFGNELFKQVSNKEHNSDIPVLAITQEHGAISRDMIDYHVSVTTKSIENYKVVEVGDFIISLRSFQGGIEYSKYKGICSPAYVILKLDVRGSKQYFGHLFKTNRFIRNLTRNLEGLRDGKMISYKQFSEVKIPVPSLPEQQKIAACLSSLDALIGAHSDKLDALKAHKKGLLQQLFPSAD